MVRSPGKWRWSSYRATAGLEEPPPFLEVGWLLSQLDLRPERAYRAYRRFVAQGEGLKIWDELKSEVILGREKFVEESKLVLEGKRPLVEIPRKERIVHRPEPEEPFAGVKKNEGAGRADLPSSGGVRMQAV